ncbi:hypothetical protein Tco_0858038 [Tanacetum coccineum]|uniref:Uncharacterized protein n=1 Tax=Tanacetum coccineum TaxID=301880 RepID=A0ABQ5BBU1_9ASTR
MTDFSVKYVGRRLDQEESLLHGIGLFGMECIQPVLHDIFLFLQPMAKQRTTISVLGRLLLAATTYYVWLERNNRIFKKVKRTLEEIIDVIMVTVCLKLLTFRFKSTNMVNKLLSRWKMPTSFRLYGGHISSL